MKQAVTLEPDQWKTITDWLDEEMIKCTYMPPFRRRYLWLEAIRDEISRQTRQVESLPETPEPMIMSAVK